RGLRIPHLRKGDDSPLRIWLLHWIRNACHTQRLPTPRRRRYGHNVTSPTRLRHSTAEWFTRSLRLCSRDARCVRAISRGTCVEICDAVRLCDPIVQSSAHGADRRFMIHVSVKGRIEWPLLIGLSVRQLKAYQAAWAVHGSFGVLGCPCLPCLRTLKPARV